MKMNKWYIRLVFYIVVIIGLNLFILAYFLGQTLQDQQPLYLNELIAISFFVSFLVLSFLIYTLIRKMVKPLGEITELIKDLNHGHYWRRIYPQEHEGAVYELANQTNQLANQLQKTTEHQSMQASQLQAVIRHMASGLLYIDHKGKIVITNQTFLDMLHWEDNHEQSIYYETPLPEDVANHIRDVFLYGDEKRKYIALDLNGKRLHIDLLVAPVKNEQDDVTGIVVVFHDITELKQLEQTRKDFVANVSHELKTPITSIKGFSETLLDGAMDSPQHLKDFLGIIYQESDRLNRLIQDLLHLSHIEQGRLHLQWKWVDLVELTNDTLQLVQPKTEQKNIQVHFDPVSQAWIEADEDRLRQVILNLLSNALQYTHEGGKVYIDIDEWEDQGYRLCIKDTGIGMKQEHMQRIFERFYRVDRDRSRASGGTGLGLAIVKHLVEAHQGEISVESEEGKGSTFHLFLHKHQPNQK